MYAVEFETVTNGRVIHIPQEYQDFASRNVKVIIMMDDKTRPLKQRKPGTAKGKIFITDDFDQP
jgi:hypothetical protein